MPLCGMTAQAEMAENGQAEQSEPAQVAATSPSAQHDQATSTTASRELLGKSASQIGTVDRPSLTARDAQAFFPPGPAPHPPHLSLPTSALTFLASYPLRYPVLSLMRQWASLQRERFCPPSSYSTASRSSLTIVDGSPLIGGSALTFIRGTKDRPAAFTRVVCCQYDDEWATAIEANAASYGADSRVTVVRQHVFAYFQKQCNVDSDVGD